MAANEKPPEIRPTLSVSQATKGEHGATSQSVCREAGVRMANAYRGGVQLTAEQLRDAFREALKWVKVKNAVRAYQIGRWP